MGAHPGARRWAAARSCAAPRAAPAGVSWPRTRPRSPTWTTPTLIVVAGDTELVHRAPILELRIRRAVDRGARVVTVGAGATRLDTLRAAEHISAAPGTAHAALLAASQGVAS